MKFLVGLIKLMGLSPTYIFGCTSTTLSTVESYQNVPQVLVRFIDNKMGLLETSNFAMPLR